MKIAVVAPSPVPFTLGGAERLYNGIVRTINEATPHDAELLKLPTRELDLPDLMTSYEAFTRVDVAHFDLVVTCKYPAWMLEHGNHVVYMAHTLRGLYDTYDVTGLPERVTYREPQLAALQGVLRAPTTDRAVLPEVFDRFRWSLADHGPDHPAFAFPGPLARELVHFVDRIALDPRHVRRHLAISATVASRRDYFPAGVPVEVAYPPSDLEGLREGAFDHFFTVSRLEHTKRIDLLVDAMRHVPHDIPLKIAGTGPELDRLRALANDDPRIEFLGYVSEQGLADLYADALAVPFVPLDEDLGLVTLEAMAGGKPVVTCHDAGGPVEFVVDGITGFVTAPDPAALGAAMARLAADPALAQRLGVAARQRAAGVTWRRAVKALLRPGGRPPTHAARRPGRPRLVMASTFAVHPALGGGQIRCLQLARVLADRFDVEIVSLTAHGEAATRLTLAPGLRETVVPKSADHEAHERGVNADVGLPVTDILAARAIGRTPAYLDALTVACRHASAAVLAHPFMYPALDLVRPDLPVVYDAHNAEFVVKDALLPDTATGRWLRDVVHEVEGAAAHAALFVAGCSRDDAAVLASEYDLDEASLVVVPNGVDTRAVPFVDGGRRAQSRRRWLDRFLADGDIRPAPRHVAVFFGAWHPPNLDAAAAVFAMAEHLPEVLFLMAGSHCQEFVGRSLPANVVLMGVVPDAVKIVLLRVADVALNPVVRGSGTNLKIVEYMAAGAPVVSTEFGARGIDMVAGEHLTIAAITDFVDAIGQVLTDPAAAYAAAVRARSLVEQQYDWQVVGARLLGRLASELDRLQASAQTLGATA